MTADLSAPKIYFSVVDRGDVVGLEPQEAGTV